MNPLLDPRTYRVARNSYWRVRDDVLDIVLLTLDVTTGEVRGTNRYYGASQVLERVTERVALRPGDEVHVLFGGTFLVRSIHGIPVAREVRWPNAGERNPYSGDDPVARALAGWLRASTTPTAAPPTKLRYRTSDRWPE